MNTPARTDRDWETRYQQHDTPWDSGLPSAELARVLQEFNVPRGGALELGCGSGTNAVFLSQLGFQVAGVDCSSTAIESARLKAARAGVAVEWITADVQNFGAGRPRVKFLFDRGCYHCCRRVDLAGYLQTHQQVTADDAWCLVLCGNKNDASEGGPPKLTAAELTTEFEPLYRIVQLREFHFEDAGGAQGPLGWSCLMRRHSPCG